ncbi:MULTISPECIES: NRAMP family divalent metal transporter [unclassified Avibacterium]|uniref:NRAMP family divalent metal transporter n=1 Tax=unclassified Avibacterium TaxID=2685287 RepID=UPI0020272B62|nr:MULTISPECIES: divalent metal cation transporter [unclassified Avibacterium]MCW9718505.1 divalent metal cation transporter [Avibacterium sp. 21-599]MCW9732058.1 divalent metal cation transporter [Avibacterium sp. 20-15]URL04237.1 divalent metal cation transporter [Avibacterium sp. 20-132]
MTINLSLLRNLGPGVIMACSCVGGSHIIASTQAGAYYGYQLAGLIILVNLLKYPFFRFAFDYSATQNKSVLQGYAEKGKGYLWLFLLFNLFATVVNIAGGTLLSAVLLAMLLPFSIDLNSLNIIVLVSFLVILFYRQYQRLDKVSKSIMLLLSVITLIALVLAFTKQTSPPVADFVPPDAWSLAAVPFLIALMGWMPAPMELSIASSLWVVQKRRLTPNYQKHHQLDFNIGYLTTIVLALMFMALGALIQYGNTIPPLSGGKFIHLFVEMYALSIGEWSRWFIALIAFVCIYGTTIVAVDGYSRCNQQTIQLLKFGAQTDVNNEKGLRYFMLAACFASFIIIQFFSGAIGKMIPFAMTASFLSAPIFAWLNLSLAKQLSPNPMLIRLAWLGLSYLVIMIIIYFIQL